MYAYETIVTTSDIDKLTIPVSIKKKLKKDSKVKLIIMIDEEDTENVVSEKVENPLYELANLSNKENLTDGSINHDKDIYI